jgi:antitoxin component YwqK of YwqJK toxin-antitoxin module
VGKHRYWYESGQLSHSGSYEGGEMHGKWDYYEFNGILTLQLEYEQGKVIRINGQKIKLPKNKDEEN